ncbi:MAG: shikimate kinase [Bacteroidetes bacterium]|nr:shikimate kinase [Bacteroidota bacterium]
MKKILFLIGMPGAGKSFWGLRLANYFQLPFVDTDNLIEQSEGFSVQQIFKQKGEPSFRQLESKVLQQIIFTAETPLIVSCGGGLPINPDNFNRMQQAGIIVYLNTSLDLIECRIRTESQTRPLFENKPHLRFYLEELFLQRHDIYSKADFIIQADHLSIHDFEPILRACIEQH